MKVFLKILPVTLLAEVACGQFCTKETLDCSKAVPAITKLGSHSCACDNEMHSGALKFDKGNLYFCSEKEWKRVALKPSLMSQKPYGSHPENPGRTCDDILAKAGGKALKNGIYWIRVQESSTLLGSETFRVYCDMETGPGGWTMVFKLNGRRNPKSLTYMAVLENFVAVEENNTDALSTKRNTDFSGYKSRIMTGEYLFLFGASEAKMVLYKDDKPLGKYITFDVKGADSYSWIVHQALKKSSWDDMIGSPFYGDNGNIFATFVKKKGVFFFDKYKSDVCEVSTGWLRVIDFGEGCQNFPFQKHAGIYFSKSNTAALWKKGEDVGEADLLVILLQ
ncbi:uncharacterized protein LOC141889965 [Acropora palmata]